MSEFLFLLGPGHLPKRASALARKHGAKLVNFTEPDGYRRHWFAAPNKGSPFNERLALALARDLAEARISTRNDD